MFHFCIHKSVSVCLSVCLCLSLSLSLYMSLSLSLSLSSIYIYCCANAYFPNFVSRLETVMRLIHTLISLITLGKCAANDWLHPGLSIALSRGRNIEKTDFDYSALVMMCSVYIYRLYQVPFLKVHNNILESYLYSANNSVLHFNSICMCEYMDTMILF